MSDIILTNAMVLTMDDERRCYRDGFVWMHDGRIHSVGPMRDLGQLPPGAEIRTLRGHHLVMPGIINTHDHPSNNVVRGAFDEGSREDYGSRMFQALRALDGPASYAGAAGPASPSSSTIAAS